ncbi:MAG: hypothetical protein VX834_01545, partial [Myxococcota bacterium]|nr:hypothetical protein [Myxococcota bacterium]
MGNATDLTLVLGSDDAFTTLRTAGRLRTTWAEADLALVGAYRGDDASTLVGLDIRGTLGVGYWLEVAASSHAWRQPDLAVGIDYSFPVLENLQILAQYYRNGRGRTTPNPLRQLSATLTPASDTEAPSPFAPILGGLDYVMVSAQQIIAPEITLSAALMTHLGDGSAVAIPTMTYTPLDWLQCSVSGQLPLSIWGSGGEFNPAASSLILTQGNRDYDLSGLVPDATITFWTRASY